MVPHCFTNIKENDSVLSNLQVAMFLAMSLSDEKKMGGTSKGVCFSIFPLPYIQRHSTLWGAATADELGSKCQPSTLRKRKNHKVWEDSKCLHQLKY